MRWLLEHRCSKQEEIMNKRVPYTIIPKYFRTINDIDNGANIKVIYWKLKCEENPSYRGCEI